MSTTSFCCECDSLLKIDVKTKLQKKKTLLKILVKQQEWTFKRAFPPAECRADYNCSSTHVAKWQGDRRVGEKCKPVSVGLRFSGMVGRVSYVFLCINYYVIKGF